MAKKPNFKPDFGPNFVSKDFFCRFYLYYMWRIVGSYHCMQFQEKLMNQTWENGKKPSFGPNFGLPIFFFKNLASSVTSCYGQLSSCIISEKTNDPILRKLNDRQSDGRTGRQMDRWMDRQMDGRTRMIS